MVGRKHYLVNRLRPSFPGSCPVLIMHCCRPTLRMPFARMTARLRGLVRIHFDLARRQNRHFWMVLIAPKDLEAFAFPLRLPHTSVGVLHRVREKDPAKYGLCAGGANARSLQGLLLPGSNGACRRPFEVVGAPQIVWCQEHL